MTFFYVDQNHWPVVVITIKGSPENDYDMKHFLESWQNLYVECMKKEEKYKLIFDARESGSIQIKYLQVLGEWLSRMKEMTENWMDRTAIIVSSPVIQVLVQVVFRIYNPVRPFKVFKNDNLEESMKWVSSEEIGDAYDSSLNLNDLNDMVKQISTNDSINFTPES